MIADGQQTGNPGEALNVLLCVTRALHQRLEQLFSIELIHTKRKVWFILFLIHKFVTEFIQQ